MTQKPARRLSKEARREQLLDAAMQIVAERGADALTMGHLAESAGVTKPIVYEHFGGRPGVLVALYRRIDERQVQALLDVLEREPRELARLARVMSTAYMHCYATAGPEWHAISAALQGDEHMAAVQQELLDGYVGIYRDTLAPFSPLSAEALQLRCVGIIGAAEAISRDMLRGRTDEATAAAALEALIVSAVQAETPGAG